MKTKKATIKPATKINVTGTLLKIEPGKSVSIKTKVIKASSIRSIVRKLNNAGYSFVSTERGLIDEVIVSRFK
jgi:hypothetical protein